MVTVLVESGVRVLSETPPTPDLDGLRKLWAQVGSHDLVQVAEQYLFMPGHAGTARACYSTSTIQSHHSTHPFGGPSQRRGCRSRGLRTTPQSAGFKSCYPAWKRKFGGIEVSEAKRLRGLEEENPRLKRLVGDQAVQIHILKEVKSAEPVCKTTGREDESQIPVRNAISRLLPGARKAWYFDSIYRYQETDNRIFSRTCSKLA